MLSSGVEVGSTVARGEGWAVTRSGEVVVMGNSEVHEVTDMDINKRKRIIAPDREIA
jgi:hypothetical protein